MNAMYAVALSLSTLLPLQEMPRAQPAGPDALWTLSMGHAVIAFRDFSQSSLPLHTSPISLEGAGLAVTGGYERSRGSRSHSVRLSVLPARSLEFAGPSDRLPAPGSESSSARLRYDYRWYPFRDIAMHGLDFGLGAVAHGGYDTIRRRVLPDNDFRVHDLEGGGGAAMHARYRPAPRLRLQGGLFGILVIGRTGEEHDVQQEQSPGRWGGGWLLGGSAEGAVRINNRIWISAAFERSGQARFASHRGLSERRRHITLGVSYAR